MGNKITNTLVSLKGNVKEKLDKSQDKKQIRAFARIIQFFMVMIVLTMIARGTQGATLATVTTIKPVGGEISEDLTFDANVVAKNAEVIEAPTDLVIKEIFVGPGQKVESGDSIAKFDTEDLEDQLIRQQAKLDELILEKNILQQGTILDDDSEDTAQISMNRTVEDYAIQFDEDQLAIERAEEKLKEAKDDLVEAEKKAAKAAKKKEEEKNKAAADEAAMGSGKNSTIGGYPDGLSSIDHWQEDGNGVEDENPTPPPTTPEPEEEDDDTDPTEMEKEAVKTAELDLENVQKTAAKNRLAFERALEDAERTLDSAQLSIYKSMLEASNTNAKNSITATVTQADIVKQQKVVDTLTSITENDGVLVASKVGTVLEVKANVGEAVTEGGEIATLTSEGGGFAAEILLDKKQVKKVNVNMPVVLTYNKEEIEGTVTSLSAKDDSGNVTAVINLPNGEWKISDSVGVDIEVSRKSYELCLPVEAIFSDSDGSYVLALEEHSTVLGIQNRLYKVPVTVLANGKTHIAVEGAVNKDLPIVSGSTKPVANGDNVRVDEG